MRKYTFIYALVDPRDGGIRYIGKADDPKTRLQYHLAHCERRKNRCSRWIRSLRDEGKRPELTVIASVPLESWAHWERYFIAEFTPLFPLLNANRGGVGGSRPPSQSFNNQKVIALISYLRKDGKSLQQIVDILYLGGIVSPSGSERWNKVSVTRLLKKV